MTHIFRRVEPPKKMGFTNNIEYYKYEWGKKNLRNNHQEIGFE
jgi:hypothetical protein